MTDKVRNTSLPRRRTPFWTSGPPRRHGFVEAKLYLAKTDLSQSSLATRLARRARGAPPGGGIPSRKRRQRFEGGGCRSSENCYSRCIRSIVLKNRSPYKNMPPGKEGECVCVCVCMYACMYVCI